MKGCGDVSTCRNAAFPSDTPGASRPTVLAAAPTQVQAHLAAAQPGWMPPQAAGVVAPCWEATFFRYEAVACLLGRASASWQRQLPAGMGGGLAPWTPLPGDTRLSSARGPSLQYTSSVGSSGSGNGQVC